MGRTNPQVNELKETLIHAQADVAGAHFEIKELTEENRILKKSIKDIKQALSDIILDNTGGD